MIILRAVISLYFHYKSIKRDHTLLLSLENLPMIEDRGTTQSDEAKEESLLNSHLEAQQWRSGAAGDKLQQLALLLVCEALDHLPKDLNDRVSGRVPT